MSALDAAQVVSQLPQKSLLLDPFCGTGTILYEAQRHGLSAIGIDNNPLACTIARGKTEPVQKSRVIEQLKQALVAAKSTSTVRKMPASPGRYFHPHTADQIMRVLGLADGFSNYLLSAFYGSICVAARACNGYLWTSTSIGRINPPLRNVDFYQTFARKVRKHLDYVGGKPTVEVLRQDARNVERLLEEHSIDVVYTSPPYFDALDYTGYYTKLVMEILDINRAEIREGLIQRYSTYKRDMTRAMKSLDRVVRDDALIIFVVGDRRVRGQLIRGSDFFTEIAPWSNPYIVERTYTKTASGIWDAINETKRREQVIVWDLKEGNRS
jgi:site-specific DNA-methyltransferase (cytosine-N4-specific)